MKSLVLVLITVTLSACAVSRGSFVPITAGHPASLQAEEAEIVDPGRALSANTHAAAERTPSKSELPPSHAHYVCPMHADVGSDVPGNCPRCGMALKEQKPEASQEEHVHDHR